MTEQNMPVTVAEAVDRLIVQLPEQDRAEIGRMEKDDLAGMHFGMGQWIRNNFGLWFPGSPLLKDTGIEHPDDASGVIIEALWNRLRNTAVSDTEPEDQRVTETDQAGNREDNAGMPENSKTVLYVDDDPTMRNLLQKILLSEGYSVLLAEHGGAALEKIAEHVDLLITGITMGPMNGDRLLEVVRQKYPDLPVIVLTCNYRIPMIEKCVNLGIYDFCKKPFSINAMKRTVRSALVYRDLLRHRNVSMPDYSEALENKLRHCKEILRENEAETPRDLMSILRNHPPVERKTILSVDDDQGPRESLRMILRYDHDVLCANGGHAGLKMLETHRVDLLITGIRMPGVCGVELLQIVREKYPDLPVLVLAGYDDLATVVKCIQLGAFDYIRKPFDSDGIQLTVRSVLASADIIRAGNNDGPSPALTEGGPRHLFSFKRFLREKDDEEITAFCNEHEGDETLAGLIPILQAQMSKNRKTILVVDDDPTILSLENKVLNSQGYNVLLAENGAVALKILGKHDVDLMMTDIKMEPVDGIQLLRAIREKGSELPVIVLTPYATVATAVECMKLGAFDYIPLPFKIDEYIQTVWNALAYGESKTTGPKPDEPEHAENSVTKPIPKLKAAEQIEPSKKTILHVDSERGPREALRMILKYDYNIFLADRGRGALELLEEKQVDLLITDFRMPEMNGLELLQLVRAKYPDLPVLVLTGYGDLAVAVEFIKLGAFDYIQKPFDAYEIQATVRRALAYGELKHSGNADDSSSGVIEARQRDLFNFKSFLRTKDDESILTFCNMHKGDETLTDLMPILEAQLSTSRKTILIVANERGFRESLRMVLKYDYEILLADGVRRGLEILEQEHVDLLISDIRMPEMSGIELLAIVRDQYPDLPVILQTGYSDLATAIQSMKLDVFDYMQLPFDCEEIQGIVRHALAYGSLQAASDASSITPGIAAAALHKWDHLKRLFPAIVDA